MVNATKNPYDLTNITSGENVLDFVVEVNKLTGQWFMMSMLLAGFVIMFISMRSFGNKEALLTAGFMTAIISIFFRALDFISTANTVITIIVFAVILAVSTQIKD